VGVFGVNLKSETISRMTANCFSVISRAIMAYLVNKYSPGHSLYPSDPQKRAQVDRLLNFDMNTLTPAQRAVHRPMIFELKSLEPEIEKAYKEKLAILETIMGTNKYLAGDTLTLADLSIFAVLSMTEVVSYDLSGFEKVKSWMDRLKGELPDYEEINGKPLRGFKAWFEAKKLEAGK